MLEREITITGGYLDNNLPYGMSWLRLGDTGSLARNKLGCDGFLFHSNHIWITEVKINNSSLTTSEEKLKNWCIIHKVPYIIIRCHSNKNLWEIYFANFNISIIKTTLKDALEELIDPFGG